MTNSQIPGQPYQDRDEYDKDLNPDPTAGFNVGMEGEKPGRFSQTAAEIDEVRSRLEGYSNSELRKILVLKPGTRLKQGATYINLNDPARKEYVGMASDSASEGDYIVPKAEMSYELWNRLTGVSQ